MIQTLQINDPIVDVKDIEKFKLAFLMQFFVQHRRRFQFPRLRLQDLYQHIVNGSEAVPLSDCIARILRFLRHRDPTISITSVDESLDRFVSEKRTAHRQALQSARAGRTIAQLDPHARALLLEHLIECVYDERPDLSFNAVLNTPNDNADKDARVLPSIDDESLLIKAGQDASGSSYYYMDDLRLYRETPQSGLSSHWSVAVGPTIQQWASFIASLSRSGEELELGRFLKKELFSYVQECIENSFLNDFVDELDSARLLDKEAAELAETRLLRKLPGVPAPLSSIKSSQSLAPQAAASLAVECGGSNSNVGAGCTNSASTRPLTPPRRTTTADCGAPQTHSSTSAKASLSSANTPSTGIRMPNSSCASFSGVSVETVRLASSFSPSQQHVTVVTGVGNKSVLGQQLRLLDSPLHRPSSGLTPVEVCPQTDGGHPHSAPPFSTPSSVGDCLRRTSMVFNPTFRSNGQKLNVVSEGFLDSCPTSIAMTLRTTRNVDTNVSGSTCPAPLAVDPPMPPLTVLVFTTELANEAAVKYRNSRMPITTFHSTHSLVQRPMLQSGNAPVVGSSVADCVVTQEQLENRKSKMAQLEKIHSKLTKSKMASTPGAATVAAMHAAAAAFNVGSRLPQPHPPSGDTICSIQHDPLHLSPADPSQQPSRMMVTRPEERDFNRTLWAQQQQKYPGTAGDTNGVHYQCNGSMDHSIVPPHSDGAVPPVLVVSPNNTCDYPPRPNKFCIPAPPAHKRPYPPEMEPGEQQYWDQQQIMFEQHQQSITATQVRFDRPTSNRIGLSKKRKSAAGSTSRSALTHSSQMLSVSPFSGPHRMPQPPPPAGVMRSAGLGSVHIELPRGSVAGSSYQIITGDPMNGAYAGPNYRGHANARAMSKQPDSPGSSCTLQPTSSQQPPTGGYTHPADSARSSSSPTQHLTSASLASLARLSKLSGSKGLFCPSSSASTNSAVSSSDPLSGYSRMVSAPEMLAYSDVADPGMMSDSKFLYTTCSAPINSSTTSGGPHQAISMSHGGQQPHQSGFPTPHPQMSPHQLFSTGPPNQSVSVGRPSDRAQPPGPSGVFTPSDQSHSIVDPSSSASLCLTPSSNSPVCHTSNSPTTHTIAISAPPLTPSMASQSASQQQQLHPHQSLQINNTFNKQLNEVQLMQQQHRLYYRDNGCRILQVPSQNQKVESRSLLPTNVQIMPNTPHTIQYLPTLSIITSASSANSSTPIVSTTVADMTGDQYLPHPASIGVNGMPQVPLSVVSVSRMQSQTLLQSAPNDSTGCSATATSVPPEHCVAEITPRQQHRQHQRGQKIDHLLTRSSQLPVAATTQGSTKSGGELLPLSDGVYTSNGVVIAAKYSQGFPISVMEASQVLQPDSASPFDYPRGVTTYDSPSSNTTASRRGHNRYSPSTGFTSSATFKMDSSLPSTLPDPVTSQVSVATAAGKKYLSSANQLCVGEMSYLQQAQMVGKGDLYVQQSQNIPGRVMMVMNPPTPTQVHEQYYMTPLGAVPSHLHHQLQMQTAPQASHSRAYPAVL